VRLIFRPRAIEDLRSIHRFITADNPVAARRFVEAIRQRCVMLREHPQVGTLRDDLRCGIRPGRRSDPPQRAG
jgi:toxin ParE1/3/4